MPAKSEAEAMQELASLMWNRYFREKVKEELNHELNGYKAEVTNNNGDGTLTVQRPFETTTLTLKAASALSRAVAGDQVLIVGMGDKSTALSNAFILGKTNMQDTRKLAESHWFTLSPGQVLSIGIGGNNYEGQADALIMPHSNSAGLNGGMLHLSSFDNRSGFHSITPVYGSTPADLTIASGAGYVSLTNGSTTYNCTLNVVVLGDKYNILSFSVS